MDFWTTSVAGHTGFLFCCWSSTLPQIFNYYDFNLPTLYPRIFLFTFFVSHENLCYVFALLLLSCFMRLQACIFRFIFISWIFKRIRFVFLSIRFHYWTWERKILILILLHVMIERVLFLLSRSWVVRKFGVFDVFYLVLINLFLPKTVEKNMHRFYFHFQGLPSIDRILCRCIDFPFVYICFSSKNFKYICHTRSSITIIRDLVTPFVTCVVCVGSAILC